MNLFQTIIEPLALGLSTGTWCAMYCGPVLLPFLMGRDSPDYRRNAGLVGIFLAGRLAAYGALGLVLGALGLLAGEFFDPVLVRRLSSAAYLACGIVLVSSIAAGRSASCRGCLLSRRFFSAAHRFIGGGDRRVSFLSGLSVGFHICPAFWTAAFRSSGAASPVSGGLYFLLFYAGTLPFFLPLLGLPFFSRRNLPPAKVARLTQLFVGAYFVVFAGMLPILFGR